MPILYLIFHAIMVSRFKDKGREILLKQIMDVTGIARQSRDRKEFEARWGAMFKNEPFQLMLMV